MSERIYTGRWTDWTYGSIMGDNWTLQSGNATYLISFIATFDVWVGSAAWDLVAFVLHQLMTIKEPRNGAAHQTQVALRNSSTPLTFIRNAIFIGWAWRKHSWSITLRTWALAIAPVVLAILFVAAGIASSQIASIENVLLEGGDCGLVNPDIASQLDTIQIRQSQAYQDGMRMSLSNSYAQECYPNPLISQESRVNNSDISDLTCQGYATVALNYTTSIADCPLNQACATPALSLDTGYLDSHLDFGLNQPQENRVSFRKVTTCAPLKTDGYSDNAFNMVDGFGDVAIYSYGNNSYQPTRFGATQGIPSVDATFVYSKNTYSSAQTAYYMLVASTMMRGASGPLFLPVPSLSTNTTKPMSLVFLANRAFYDGIVNDPWFNATSPIGSTANGDVAYALYENNSPGAVMGCTEQLQICNPNAKSSSKCTDLDSWASWGDFTTYYKFGNISALVDIGLNDMQMTTAMMLQDAAIGGTVWNVVDQLGYKALIASSYVSQQETFWSAALPDNQWQIEVANWFAIGLAHTQRLFIANYRKPSTKALVDQWQPFPSNATNENVFCSSQKVHSASYTTFSVVGLGLNFGIGAIILILGYLLPFMIPRLQLRRARKKGRISMAGEQWILNHALQLQRVAYEAMGIGTWTRKESTVPVTTELEAVESSSSLLIASSLRGRQRHAEDEMVEHSALSSSTMLSRYEAPLLPKSSGHEIEEEG